MPRGGISSDKRWRFLAVSAARNDGLLSDHRRELAHELAHAVAGHRRNLVIVVSVTLRIRAELLAVAGDGRIELRAANEPRLRCEHFRMKLQLMRHHLSVRFGMFVRRKV